MKWNAILLLSSLVVFTLSTVPYQLLRAPMNSDTDGMMKQTATPVVLPTESCLQQRTPFPPDSIPWFDFDSASELWMIYLGDTETYSAFNVCLRPFEKPVRFLVFSSGYMADDSQGSGMGRFLSFGETIRCFRSAYSRNSIRTTRMINRIRVEIFKPKVAPSKDNCVTLHENVGAVLFWYKAPYGFALIDLTEEHLRAGIVEKFMASFKFKKAPIIKPR